MIEAEANAQADCFDAHDAVVQVGQVDVVVASPPRAQGTELKIDGAAFSQSRVRP